MLARVFAGLALTVPGVSSAIAHTTDALHPHPHSMDLTSPEGAAVVVLIMVAFGLFIVARNLTASGRETVKTNRGHQ
ncbi:MAG: hypothetical protein ACI89J_003867 [Hyphomicrobiaceae bacterium]|jgi:hypothetical protein